ncbi:MAG: hypothetical protein FWH22_02170 [Fibromonadales bacterium]|nr:hypothetical protein [Fibromonadales bacterium]
MPKAFSLFFRVAAIILITYVALAFYIYMRKENVLAFARQEVEIKQGDTLLVIGYRLGSARAKEYADSLAKENIPNKLQLTEPIYDEKEYLHKRYGIFYPRF